MLLSWNFVLFSREIFLEYVIINKDINIKLSIIDYRGVESSKFVHDGEFSSLSRKLISALSKPERPS